MDADLPLDTGPSSVTHVLVASAGEAFDDKVIEGAVRLAGKNRPVMHVVSIARVWGTSLGLQHPGLKPTKQEWRAQAEIVAHAVKALQRRGFEADGRVVASRHPDKAIATVAEGTHCDAVIMGRPSVTGWRRLVNPDDSKGVARRAKRIPVYGVPLD